jgi:hypothetical protein
MNYIYYTIIVRFPFDLFNKYLASQTIMSQFMNGHPRVSGWSNEEDILSSWVNTLQSQEGKRILDEENGSN